MCENSSSIAITRMVFKLQPAVVAICFLFIVLSIFDRFFSFSYNIPAGNISNMGLQYYGGTIFHRRYGVPTVRTY